jgi:hypothetical protein
MLTDELKNRMGSAFTFLERCLKDGDKCLNYFGLETDSGTWVLFVNIETKEQT